MWCDTGVCCACACVFGAHVNLVHFFFFGWCHFNKCKTTTKLVEKFIPPRRRPCVSVATQRRINQLLIKALSTRVRHAFTNGQRKLKLNRYWHHNPCDPFSGKVQLNSIVFSVRACTKKQSFFSGVNFVCVLKSSAYARTAQQHV